MGADNSGPGRHHSILYTDRQILCSERIRHDSLVGYVREGEAGRGRQRRREGEAAKEGGRGRRGEREEEEVELG